MGYPRPLSIFAAVSNRNSWPGPVALAVALLLGLLLASLPLPIAAIVIVATITFLLALIQPLFALALALLAGPLGALEQLLSGSISLDSGQLLLLLALSAWIGHSLAQRRLHIAHTFLNLPFFLLILVGALSLLGSQSIEVGAKELLKWLEMAVIMLMVLDLGQKGAVSAKGNPRESYIGGPTRTFWIVGMLLLAGISQADLEKIQ